MQHHPDRNPGDKKAEEKFKEAAEAYAVLADAEKRAAYDRFGHAGVSAAAGAGAGFDPRDLRRLRRHPRQHVRLRRPVRRRRRRGGPQRGADLRYDLEISFLESATGAEPTIQIPRQETCETCKGSGAAAGSIADHLLDVPRPGPGAAAAGFLHDRRHLPAVPRRRPDDRQAVPDVPRRGPRDAGTQDQGEDPGRASPTASSSGCRTKAKRAPAAALPGHLYVVVHVQEHEFFRREGNHLFCEVPVNFTTLALGGEIVVPTLDGQERMKIPDGTQTGTTLRLRGKGMPDVNGRGRGDLLVTVQVQTPKKLTQGTAAPARAARRRHCRRKSSSLARPAKNRTTATCSTASRICSGRSALPGRLNHRSLTASSCSLSADDSLPYRR